MAAKDAEAAGSFLANPHAWLALVTITGGLWLVSNKLTSNRPVAPVSSAKEFIAEQNVEARLWEDPFKHVSPPGDGATAKGPPRSGTLETLVDQIARKADRPGAVVLLPVMLPGGHYSEDREARIRSRFAIVSALGVSAYAPEDAEHIGAATIPWPTQRQLVEAREKLCPDQDLRHLWESPGENARIFGLKLKESLATMDVRYEWYRPRTFAPGSANKKDRPAVLVLWLDDTFFEDEPLLRLPLLLEPLVEKIPVTPNETARSVRLIGPRRSSTLRIMLPEWGTETERLAKYPNKEVGVLARRVLGRIDAYSATASAMDEVLVRDSADSNPRPRGAVQELLQKQGFGSIRNFAATDAQLADEIYKELELRHASLTRDEHHVALIYEGDTFYGRMLALTYAARLATQRSAFATGADYVDKETRTPTGVTPKNFHSFVYMRGLDGQTIGADGASKEGSDDRKKSARPASLEDLTRWSPDINKAEGQAQFDYLGRLGDRLEQLQRKLRFEGAGRIKAIGIVGSDVYDTLLILQALRQRFPNVYFFTTDLDVRFLHPQEREWTRNLIVASSYGFQLHHSLQGTVAPFRDSTQTAQFAATLAAFGAPGLSELATIPPRRFEIGNGVAVDLSVEPNVELPGTSAPARGDEPRYLHPLTLSESDHRVSDRVRWGLTAGVLALLGASLMWDRLRRVTWQGWSYPGKALEFSEEDIGGAEGAEMLRQWIRDPKKKSDAVVQWLRSDRRLSGIAARLDPPPPNEKNGGDHSANKAGKPASDGKADKQIDWKREDALADLTLCFVGRLNQCFPRKGGKRSKEDQECLQQIMREVWGNTGPNRANWAFWPPARAMAEQEHIRIYLDAFLDRVEAPSASAKERAPVEQLARAAEGTSAPKAIAKRSASEKTAAGSTSDKKAAVKTAEPPSPPTDIKPTDIKEMEKIYRLLVGSTDETPDQSVLRAARSARQSAGEIYALRQQQLGGFWLSVAVFGVAAWALGGAIWQDAFQNAEGEPFSLSNGTSAWPAQIVRLFVCLLAVCFTVGLRHTIRESFFALTRGFRFAEREDRTAVANEASAESLWFAHRDNCDPRKRWGIILLGLVLYFLGLMAIYQAQGEEVLNPVRGDAIHRWNQALTLAAVLGLLVLAFLTIDAALRCRDFIKQLSDHPTEYPRATRQHFARKRGKIDEHYIDEWLDLQLIAELTEKVGKFVYYPTCLVLLLLLARNSWWDAWSWPESVIVCFALNFTLALTSVAILQRAARDAKRKAEESMETKVKRLKAQTAPSEVANNASQAEKLLEEMRQLRRGAFVPFWENPVVGAIFLSSGGTTLLQVFIWFMNR